MFMAYFIHNFLTKTFRPHQDIIIIIIIITRIKRYKFG
jgi:hypothetical protein